MRILVIEDNDDKFAAISSRLTGFRGFAATSITRASTFSMASKAIYESQFDLIVVDLMMPGREGDRPQDVTEDVLAALQLSEKNAGTGIIALSGFEDLVEDQRVRFADAGIILTYFDADGEVWGRQLDAALLRTREQTVFDFVIICALEKERAAFSRTTAKLGELRNIKGLDCLEVSIAERNGVAIKLPRMGLVNAAAVTARAIERFRPRVVATAGICAGVSGKAAIGTLLIGDICWEYQAGKWSDDGFKMEHYDVGLDPEIRTVLSQLIQGDPKGTKLKVGLLEDAAVFQSIDIAPISTGSAVVADKARMDAIAEQHRKMAGLDMEMYGVYQAAALSSLKPVVFGAKTVVDVGDGNKSDAYHEYGCALSARFVAAAIAELFRTVV